MRYSDLVGVTGLEPAAPRPPDARATNCATPRNTSYGRKVVGMTGFEPAAPTSRT